MSLFMENFSQACGPLAILGFPDVRLLPVPRMGSWAQPPALMRIKVRLLQSLTFMTLI